MGNRITETVKTIKRVMDRQGVSQVNLAKRMRVTPVSVCRWFKGERQPSIENIERMAEALDLRIVVTFK